MKTDHRAFLASAAVAGALVALASHPRLHVRACIDRAAIPADGGWVRVAFDPPVALAAGQVAVIHYGLCDDTTTPVPMPFRSPSSARLEGASVWAWADVEGAIGR